MTICLNDTDYFLHQLINSHLASGNFGPEQLVDELNSVQSRDLGSLTLGTPALAIPLNGRRQAISLANASDVPAKRLSTSSGNSIIKMLVPFAMLMTLFAWLPLP